MDIQFLREKIYICTFNWYQGRYIKFFLWRLRMNECNLVEQSMKVELKLSIDMGIKMPIVA